MSNVTLNKTEIALLKGAVRRGDSDKGFNELLNTLAELLNDKSGTLYISNTTLEEIQKYGRHSRTSVWRAILHGVFARSLGEELGEVRDPSGKLSEQGGRDIPAFPTPTAKPDVHNTGETTPDAGEQSPS